MKGISLRLFFLCLFSLSALVQCDNTELSPDQADSFIKFFGSWNFDEGKDVKQIKGGYIIVGTTTLPTDNGNDIILIKTDEYGNTVWEKTFGGADDDMGAKVLVLSDGYIVLGTITDDIYNKDIYVVKVDKKGEKQWDKQIGGVFDEIGNSIVSIENDGFVICGSTTEPNDANHNDAGKANIYLVKIDNTGQVVWSNSYGGSGDEYGNDLVVTSSGFLIIGTTNSFSEPQQSGNNIILVKTNSLGFETAKITYGGTFADAGYAIIPSNTTGYIIVGSKGVSATSSKVFMAKVQEDINYIDFIKEELGTEPNNGVGYDVINFGGGYTVVGAKNLNEKNAGYFIQTDYEGNTINEMQIGGYDDQSFYAVDNASDGGFIMVGKSGLGSNYMICMVKVNSEGEL